MIDPVKELFQVHVHGPPVPFVDITLGLVDSLMHRTPRSEAIAGMGEALVLLRLQNLEQRLLDQAVECGRGRSLNPQRFSAARSVPAQQQEISQGKTPDFHCVDAGFIKRRQLQMEGLVVTCPLAPPASHLISSSCSSPRNCALGFLRTFPRGFALACASRCA